MTERINKTNKKPIAISILKTDCVDKYIKYVCPKSDWSVENFQLDKIFKVQLSIVYNNNILYIKTRIS